MPADPEVRAAALKVAAHDSAKAILGVVIGIPFTVLMIVAVFSHRYDSARPLFIPWQCYLSSSSPIRSTSGDT